MVTIRNGGVNQQRSFTHNLIIQKIKKRAGIPRLVACLSHFIPLPGVLNEFPHHGAARCYRASRRAGEAAPGCGEFTSGWGCTRVRGGLSSLGDPNSDRALQELGEERMQRQSLEIQLQSFRNAGFKDPEVTGEQNLGHGMPWVIFRFSGTQD